MASERPDNVVIPEPSSDCAAIHLVGCRPHRRRPTQGPAHICTTSAPSRSTQPLSPRGLRNACAGLEISLILPMSFRIAPVQGAQPLRTLEAPKSTTPCLRLQKVLVATLRVATPASVTE